MSESDYPLETFYWTGETDVTHQYLRGVAEQAAGATVEVRSVDDFFRVAMSEPEWKGEQQLATARRYQNLVRLLKENLDDLKVYRIGEINIQVFIVGKAESGNWIGLSTRVVET